MRKLQVQEAGGSWSWVFGRNMPSKTLATCTDKTKALPSKAIWAEDDLSWARQTFPDRTFRLAFSLDEEVECKNARGRVPSLQPAI